MTRKTRIPTIVSILLGAVLASGCGTAPPQAPAPTPAAPPAPPEPVPAPPPVAVAPTLPAFAPSGVAQGALVASLVSVAPGRIVSDLDALSRRLDLPVVLGQQLLAALGAEGLAGSDVRLHDLVERIDPQTALAIVWTMPQEAKARGFCAALTFKEADLAKRTAEEMGKAGSVKDGVVERRATSGDAIFTAVKGRTLFVSGSTEALLLAGGLAEAAQVPPTRGQIVLSVLPQALAKASGKSPEAIVAELTSRASKEKPAASGSKAMHQFGIALLEGLIRTGLDAALVRLMIEAGPGDGLLISTELVPASGTRLASRAAKRAPSAFDPRLPVASDGTNVFAVGDVTDWIPAFANIIESTGPSGQALLRDVQAYVAAVSDWSCSIDPVDSGLSGLCSSSLRRGVSEKAALDAAVAMMSSQHAWDADLEGRKAKPLKIKRSANLVEVERKIENKDATARAFAKALAGGELARYAFMVKNGRLLQASGAKPKDILARYGSGASAQDAPVVAATLARGKDDEFLASLDVISVVLRVLSQGKGLPGSDMAAMAKAIPGVAELKAPFRIALRTGGSLVGEFHIPLASLERVAKVVRGLMAGPAQ